MMIELPFGKLVFKITHLLTRKLWYHQRQVVAPPSPYFFFSPTAFVQLRLDLSLHKNTSVPISDLFPHFPQEKTSSLRPFEKAKTKIFLRPSRPTYIKHLNPQFGPIKGHFLKLAYRRHCFGLATTFSTWGLAFLYVVSFQRSFESIRSNDCFFGAGVFVEFSESV